MGLKEFFRFTKAKIILAFILFILSVIFSIILLLISLGILFDYYLGINIPEPIFWLIYFLCLVIIYFFCYLISCVFAWIFSKFRK